MSNNPVPSAEEILNSTIYKDIPFVTDNGTPGTESFPSVVEPVSPVVKPESPVVEPVSPVVEPEPSVVEPEPSVVEPVSPVVEPEPSVVEPEPSVVEPEPSVVEPESSVVEPEPSVVEPKSSNEVTLKINRETLISLAQNLNTNLLVSISAYKNVLSKLKEITSDSKLESNLQTLNELEQIASELMNNMQTNLGVEPEKMIDPTKVIEESTGSSSFMSKLFGAEAAAILGSMMAATVLLGGAKRKKNTKRKRVKKQKKTKRAPKL
jgi:hypothetical protein